MVRSFNNSSVSCNWCSDQFRLILLLINPLQDLFDNSMAALVNALNFQLNASSLYGQTYSCQHEMSSELQELPDATGDGLIFLWRSSSFFLIPKQWILFRLELVPRFLHQTSPFLIANNVEISYDFLSDHFLEYQVSWYVIAKVVFTAFSTVKRMHWLLQCSFSFDLFTDHRNLTFSFEPLQVVKGLSKKSPRTGLWWIVRVQHGSSSRARIPTPSCTFSNLWRVSRSTFLVDGSSCLLLVASSKFPFFHIPRLSDLSGLLFPRFNLSERHPWLSVTSTLVLPPGSGLMLMYFTGRFIGPSTSSLQHFQHGSQSPPRCWVDIVHSLSALSLNFCANRSWHLCPCV